MKAQLPWKSVGEVARHIAPRFVRLSAGFRPCRSCGQPVRGRKQPAPLCATCRSFETSARFARYCVESCRSDRGSHVG
jgi:hypothetical protein